MRKIFKSINEVFKGPYYWLIALFSAMLTGAGMIWISNYSVIKLALFSDAFEGFEGIKLIFLSLGSFVTNFTLVSQIMIILVSLLVGINVALLTFYFKKRRALQRSAGTSALGVFIGIFGVGCSACGSVLLSSIFGISTSFAIISFLPLGGLEFGLIGILLISFSIYNIAKKIQSPAICKVEQPSKIIK